MKTNTTIILLFLILNIAGLKAQGVGMGYLFDVGGKEAKSYADGYDQTIQTHIHNGFFRYHTPSGKNALQFQVGYRTDSIGFENKSSFLSSDLNTMDAFNVNAYLIRHSIRLGGLGHFQMGKKPGKFILALNAGFFYEYTLDMYREEISQTYTYDLNDEINKNNLIFVLGAEVRFSWFTIGYKYENMLFDMLDHKYINSQIPSHNNSTELRGLKLDPVLGMIYLGINIDVFND